MILIGHITVDGSHDPSPWKRYLESIFYYRPATAPAGCPQQQPKYSCPWIWLSSKLVQYLSSFITGMDILLYVFLLACCLQCENSWKKIISGTKSQGCFDPPHVFIIAVALQSSSTIRHVVLHLRSRQERTIMEGQQQRPDKAELQAPLACFRFLAFSEIWNTSKVKLTDACLFCISEVYTFLKFERCRRKLCSLRPF